MPGHLSLLMPSNALIYQVFEWAKQTPVPFPGSLSPDDDTYLLPNSGHRMAFDSYLAPRDQGFNSDACAFPCFRYDFPTYT